MKNKKILILANLDVGLYKFRKALIKKLIDQGNEVYISLPKGMLVQNLKEMGCHFIETPVDRRGINPATDLKLMMRYFNILGKIKPDLVITYTIKPNIYGGIAARFKRIPYAVNITGLGTAFQNENMIKKLVVFLYKLSCKKAKTIFFENEGNKQVFIENNIIKESRSCTLPGAGIDLDEYKMTPYPEESRNIRFLFIGRVMKEKGVEELFKAAKNIKKIYPEVSFDIVGPMEDDYKERIQSLVRNGIIYYYGYQEDVKPFIKKCDCFVLPSYHEGMANTLLECGAMGRPLITSRIHGCMEAVRDGENGYLVDVKDVKGLEEKMMEFIELSYEEKKQMGEKSREVIEKRNGRTDIFLPSNEQEDLKKSIQIMPELYENRMLQIIWNKIFWLDVIKQNHIRFKEEMFIGEDFRFLLEYMKAAKISGFFFVNKALCHYMRDNENSLMSRLLETKIQDSLDNLKIMYELMGKSADEIQKLIATEKEKQIEYYAYTIMHDENMTTKEKKERIFQLPSDCAEQLYKQQKALQRKEGIYRLKSKLLKK